MNDFEVPLRFWTRWLYGVTLAVMAFGLILVLCPQITREGFSLLVYGDTARIAAFDPEAVKYIALVHAVLGAVMFGWGTALLFVLWGPFSRGSFEGWQIIAVSVSAWFVPDTFFSFWSGFWQNGVINIVFAALFATPLVATYKKFSVRRT